MGRRAALAAARAATPLDTGRAMRSYARVRTTSRAAFALSFAAACSSPRTPPESPVPPALVLAVPPATDADAGTRGPSAAFAPLRDRVLAELFDDDPTGARDLGLHEYDGKVAPMSHEALAARAARLEEAAASLEAVDRAPLSDDDTLDLASLKTQVQTALFFLVDVDSPRKVPQFYESLFSVDTFVDREYAPLEERARRLLAHEEAALAEVAHARENLTPPLSKPVAEVAARNYAGFASYLRVDVARVMGKLGDDAQRARFKKANEGLAAAAADLAAWLTREAAHGDQSHVLGPLRYAKLLRVQEGVTEPLDAFARMNEDDLAANKKAYEAVAASVRPKPVREADYFATAARMMHDARAFVVSHAIVDLPSDDDAVIRETPAYKRWNAASIEMSGPFDTVRSAFYYLTLPDKAWPEKERQAYLGSMGDLLGTTIHEVYPGHFVQGRWQERAPTRAQRAADDYAFVEGWAHYSEQMMIEEGFGKEDPANVLAMLGGALLRNCRFAASVGIHTRGMTVEEAARRFVSDCHQDEATAREQAVRGTFDPGYFAYTLGKLQIIALRDEAKRALGPAFSLAKFHDALLAHGAPPIALLHDRVLRDLGVPPR
jgi:uncharacterized protein (DUF885 family)